MRRRSLLPIDWWILLPAFVLITLSLITLASVNIVYFRGQLMYVGVSLIAFYFFCRLDYNLLQPLSKPLYFISLFLLIVVLIIGIESRGAVRWIDIFGIRIQFSEIFKPLLTICFASFLAQHEDRSLRSFILSFVFLFPIAFCIFLQPDLGNALIYVGVVLITLFVYGYPVYWFGLGFLPLLILSPFLWGTLHDYQRQRVLTFFHPTSDPRGTSYNVIQAIIAVGSGGLLGKGLGEGTQSGLRFLPEKHTDFIFATLSEGLGFIGAVIIIISFIFLAWRIYLIFDRAESSYERLLVTCSLSFLLINFFVNIGMNIGIFPIVGVTLPFVSFGGSSMLSNFIFLGILSSVSTSQKSKAVLEIH